MKVRSLLVVPKCRGVVGEEVHLLVEAALLEVVAVVHREADHLVVLVDVGLVVEVLRVEVLAEAELREVLKCYV